MECCGEPFETGSMVQWTGRVVTDDYLVDVLGEALASEVRYAEGHHVPTDGARFGGLVVSIRSVSCRYGRGITPVSKDRRASGFGGDIPIVGTAVIVPVTSTADSVLSDDGLDFRGWLVELDSTID